MTARRQTDDIDIETIVDVKVLQDWRKSVDKKLNNIEKTLNNLPDDLITKLDERYAAKREVEELKETVDPITKLRKRLWAWAVGLLAIEVLALYAIQLWIKDLTK